MSHEHLPDLISIHIFNVIKIFFSQHLDSCEIGPSLFFLFLLFLFANTLACLHRLQLFNSCPQSFHPLVFRFLLKLLFLKDGSCLSFYALVRDIIISISILFSKAVDEDGEEEIEQDEVSNEDPRYVVDGSYSLDNRVVVGGTHG